MKPTSRILPIIVIAQFFCTSLWFAGNGVMKDLVLNFNLSEDAVGHLTSAVQFGFIFGTLLFAFLTIADRFSPSKVFFICAICGAFINLGILWEENSFTGLMIFRFLTGFTLAGIYPVGMKIASDYFDKGLGKSLGFLVGALVLGTALPHLLNEISGSNALPWKTVIMATSFLALAGGILIYFFVPNGPYRTQRSKFDTALFFKVFKTERFRAAAFGYFGHMWELYAFWAFIPFILKIYQEYHPFTHFNISLWSFIIIASGTVACILAGYLSEKLGTRKVAGGFLTLSGICCLASSLFFVFASEGIFILFLIFWGFVVVGDSPLFSTLVAHNSPAENRGTALTIVNCIGFAITILSIQLITLLLNSIEQKNLFIILSLGPIFGIFALKPFRKEY
ncbi:MFS transporter [Gramella sp. AN32]|uniref:Nitrate/nitrite transporter n=1 Tax=Christiangramia antarctica TaxID=2058158 RepID=A0ABW5X9T7_9FLAO|nr:MFS transporter [Gramella sp. AN32]MCM4154492.1 MFS transporter [Gramella sp. AN32]